MKWLCVSLIQFLWLDSWIQKNVPPLTPLCTKANNVKKPIRYTSISKLFGFVLHFDFLLCGVISGILRHFFKMFFIASSTIPCRTFNIHRTFTFHKRFFISERFFGKPIMFFCCCMAKPLLVTLFFTCWLVRAYSALLFSKLFEWFCFLLLLYALI